MIPYPLLEIKIKYNWFATVYSLWDLLNQCKLDEWTIHTKADFHEMKNDLRIFGFNI